MKLHVANFFDAPRLTGVAGEAIPEGSVILLFGSNAAGERVFKAVTNGQSALLVNGNYGVALKISKEPNAVASSTAPASFGDRTVTIVSGDLITQVKRGAILEYSVSLLHDSLNPNTAGTLPVAGAALGIVGGKFCSAGTGSAITSPVIGRCLDIIGSKVRIELV